jgi:site-specific DNA recombinase
MKPTQVALYARVSSDQQSEAKTIESQVADLRNRIAATEAPLCAELEFIDNGYSGATLIRPALERLRDVAAAGGIDQLYVHCPDRLARNYAHQVLLLEEFCGQAWKSSSSTEKSDKHRKINCCCKCRG